MFFIKQLVMLNKLNETVEKLIKKPRKVISWLFLDLQSF